MGHPNTHIHNYIKNASETDTLLENQAFLPFQLEAALGALTLFAGAACHFVAESDWGGAALFAFLTTATTLLSFSPRGSSLHLIAVGLRLIFSGWWSYNLNVAILKVLPKSWDTGLRGFFWLLIGPLVWIVELAPFFNLDHPIFPIIWSVRRVTMTGALITLGLDEKAPKLLRSCALSMGVIMIVHTILNLSEKDHYVTLATVLLLSIEYLFWKQHRKTADEMHQKK